MASSYHLSRIERAATRNHTLDMADSLSNRANDDKIRPS